MLFNIVGVRLDSMVMTISLSHQKVHECQGLIQTWIARKSCEKKELECLVWKFVHASKVVHPGKMFLRNMFGLVTVSNAICQIP